MRYVPRAISRRPVAERPAAPGPLSTGLLPDGPLPPHPAALRGPVALVGTPPPGTARASGAVRTADPVPPPGLPPAGDRPGHRVDVTENGSFCTARCSCGWYAPARRSRDRARRDAAEHAAA